MKKITKILDNYKPLQELIDSKDWATDNIGLLVNKAVRLCREAGATEGEAYEYLEIS